MCSLYSSDIVGIDVNNVLVAVSAQQIKRSKCYSLCTVTAKNILTWLFAMM